MPTLKVGELDNFTYLMENTKFSSNSNASWAWWLEDASSDNSTHTLMVTGGSHFTGYDTASNANGTGVRPAIEVSKKNIEY